MRYFLFSILLVLLAGCTTTDQANTALTSKFAGRKTDTFFLQYGPPSSRHELDDGRTMYVWAERARTYSTPSSSTVNMIGNVAYVNTTPGATFEVQCQVRIVSGANGTIDQIVVQNDSIGDWQMSRCNEVFNKV